jgi:preprotein translocase subunit SecG
MITLDTLTLIAHVLIAVTIIGLVLVQKGKGADAGAGFGAGASGTVFGASGSANFLSRSTAVAATLFFASSLGLAYLNSSREPQSSLLDEVVVETDLVNEGDSATSQLLDSLELPPLEELEPVNGGLWDESLPEVPEPLGASQ